ncbi:hypothetical protein [Aliiglaciecola sp. LCG003]|uniref:hypothetical protein n=1 Tax=Aliiglaciecola sp. LCG003 TaxID=3053655 RepID=UPI002573A344|nr:hypothetical protein [Aliiglaciecola sp. LCG003]WJG07681.1 hypothetical protein QR722_09890 [Aliiglaciecola sp. LCG003]
MSNPINELVALSQSQGIIRRYFVVNGFDGALTMLGLISGFLFSHSIDISSVMNVCLGAAIALSVSGFSSAYVSESAERKYVLNKLEESMLTDLSQTSHAEAARWVPIFVALVNGLAPLVISLLILLPLWLAHIGIALPISPLWLCVCIAMLLIFTLGIFLSQVSGHSWFISGMKTLLVGLVTILLIYLIVEG